VSSLHKDWCTKCLLLLKFLHAGLPLSCSPCVLTTGYWSPASQRASFCLPGDSMLVLARENQKTLLLLELSYTFFHESQPHIPEFSLSLVFSLSSRVPQAVSLYLIATLCQSLVTQLCLFALLGIDPRVSYMLGKSSTTWAASGRLPPALLFAFFFFGDMFSLTLPRLALNS
jgi:hypothetical protein